MKKVVIIIVALLAIGGGVAAFMMREDPNKEKENANQTNNSTTETQESTGTEHAEETETTEANHVEIVDFAFKPANITVKKGTTVTWTNKDSVGHTVTPDEESSAFEGSDLLDHDESYSFTFGEVGTYNYHCQPHPQMTGMVTVTE